MKKRFLENSPLFGVLSDEERQALASQMTLNQFRKGEALFEEGAPSQAFYLLRSGLVRLSERIGQNGKERTLANLGPGSLVGEVDLLVGRPYSSSARAMTDVDAWELTQTGLTAVLASFPAISVKLSSFLGERVADLDRYIVDRLYQMPVLREVERPALEALAAALELQEARRGALIFQAGASADSIYLIEAGEVTLVSAVADDPEPFRQFGPGELLGVEAVLSGRPYGAVARAGTDAQLWRLRREDFESLAYRFPTLRDALTRHARQHRVGPADRNAAREALRRVPLFAEVPEAVLEAVVRHLGLRHVEKDEVIYQDGEPGDALYVVDQGAVRLIEEGEGVERVEAGGYFGEMALLTGKTRSRTAVAARKTTLWVLSKRDFDALSVREPILAHTVSRLLSEGLARGYPEEQKGNNLRRFAIFNKLSDEELSEVSRRLVRRRAAANEIIYRRGDVGDRFFLVESGQVKLIAQTGVVDLIGPGGFFGESALLTGDPRKVTAQAVADTELLVLERDQFEAILSRFPGVAVMLSRALNARTEPGGHKGGETTAAPAVVSARGRAPAGPGRPVAVTGARGNGEGAGGVRAWFAALSTGAKVRLLAIGVLLLYLFGIAAPTILVGNLSIGGNSRGSSVTESGIGGAALSLVQDPTATATASPEPTATPEPTSTPEPSPTPAPTNTAEPTATPEATETPEATATTEPTVTPAPTNTAEPTAVPPTAVPPTEAPLPTQPVAIAAAPEPTTPPPPTEAPPPPPTETPPPPPTEAPPPPPPTEPPPPQPPTSRPQPEWDPRLSNELFMIWEPAQVASGQPYWRLVRARLCKDDECGGMTNVFFKIYDESGNQLEGVAARLSWPEGSNVSLSKGGSDWSDFPLYGHDGWFPADCHCRGGYNFNVEGLPSDRVLGMGLPANLHFSYFLEYQRSIAP